MRVRYLCLSSVSVCLSVCLSSVALCICACVRVCACVRLSGGKRAYIWLERGLESRRAMLAKRNLKSSGLFMSRSSCRYTFDVCVKKRSEAHFSLSTAHLGHAFFCSAVQGKVRTGVGVALWVAVVGSRTWLRRARRTCSESCETVSL